MSLNDPCLVEFMTLCNPFPLHVSWTQQLSSHTGRVMCRAGFMGLWPVHTGPCTWFNVLLSSTWNFIFEFRKWSPVTQWSVHMSRRDRLTICLLSWPPLSHKCSRWPRAQDSGGPLIHGSSIRLKASTKLVGLLLQSNKWGYWQPDKTSFPFQTRTCLILWTYYKSVYILWSLGRPQTIVISKNFSFPKNQFSPCRECSFSPIGNTWSLRWGDYSGLSGWTHSNHRSL